MNRLSNSPWQKDLHPGHSLHWKISMTCPMLLRYPQTIELRHILLSLVVQNLWIKKECCKQVIKESLRMASIVPWFPRLALEDTEIHGLPSNSESQEKNSLIFPQAWTFSRCFSMWLIVGYKIKKGWNINIDARSIHLDPTVYNDPNKFIPSRFDVSLFVILLLFSLSNPHKKRWLAS